MSDTSPAMEEKMREIIRAKTPVERMKMGCSMYETSRYLIIRAILGNNPTISNNDLRKEIFLHFYRNDYSPLEREKIAKSLQSYNSI